jgi:hypothetical protein
LGDWVCSFDRDYLDRVRSVLVSLILLGCGACMGSDDGADAGVGGDRSGCGLPGTHSVVLALNSCACLDGYAWCSDALDQFDCCVRDPSEREPDTDVPTQTCDDSRRETIVCVSGRPGTDPSASRIWACNGDRWVLAPSYATFACAAEGFSFAYACVPDEPEPRFVCGYGTGSTCDVDEFGGICVDEDIIDTCVWGLRSIDRCSRLCREIEAYGPGFASGRCVQASPEPTATCECEV